MEWELLGSRRHPKDIFQNLTSFWINSILPLKLLCHGSVPLRYQISDPRGKTTSHVGNRSERDWVSGGMANISIHSGLILMSS